MRNAKNAGPGEQATSEAHDPAGESQLLIGEAAPDERPQVHFAGKALFYRRCDSPQGFKMRHKISRRSGHRLLGGLTKKMPN